jgi:hypothetical protein
MHVKPCQRSVYDRKSSETGRRRMVGIRLELLEKLLNVSLREVNLRDVEYGATDTK